MLDRLIANRFVLEREAGAGGMGTVYRAYDQQARETVAVKILRGVGGAEIDRFVREARALSEIRHPAIVRYVAHGTDAAGEMYLAMEWLLGEDLGARLQRSGLTVAESVALGRIVAEALTIIHAQAVVHRDLKPSNLFLPGGDIAQIKIIDFGIARLGFATHSATGTGVGMGTPGYMAPEQARGARDVDGRADVFSLGCVLFECLTGRPAFEGIHAMAILTKLLFEEAPRVSDFCPEAPAALDALVGRMLSKDPSQRPPSAALVAEELATIEPLALLVHGRRDASERAAATRTDVGPTPEIGGGEQRIVSVLLVAAALSGDEPTMDRANFENEATLPAGSTGPRLMSEDVLREVAAEHTGRCARLLDGTQAIVIMGEGAATDRAVLAARCAIALRSNCVVHRIALATGRGSMNGSGPVGETIDRAAKLLLSVSEGRSRGIIQIDELTAGLLGDRFDVRTDSGLLVLCEEREPGEEPRTLLGKPTTCVGRDRELRLLEELYDECASEPAARAVLITAEPGVGKSRMRRELVRRLRASPEAAEIWSAHGDPMRSGTPFGMLGQLIRGAAGLKGGEPLDAHRRALADFVARRAAEEKRRRITVFLGEIAGAQFPDDDSIELRAARQDPILMGDQIRRAWTEIAEAICGAGPLVIVFDDLHWGDAPTVDCVDAALRVLRNRPFMVLALARPSVSDVFPKLWAMRGVQAIPLGELSQKACARLAREVLGDNVPSTTIERLWQRSAGNAFFLEELLRAEAEGRGGDVPPTVLAMLQSRIDGLSQTERRVLQLASVLGEDFWRGALLEQSGGHASSFELKAVLQRLEDQELIVRRTTSRFEPEVEYTFRHALVRDAAYGLFAEDDRAQAHALVGAWLERAGELDAAVLAEHFERGRDLARAAVWFYRSAELSFEANDFTTTIERARRCEECGATGAMLGEARVIAAAANRWLGRMGEGKAWAAAALNVSPKGSASWYDALLELIRTSSSEGDRERTAEIAAMMSEMPVEPLAERARVLARAQAAAALLYVDANEEAKLLLREIEASSSKWSEDPSVRAQILYASFMYAFHSGFIEKSLEIMVEIVELSRIAGRERQLCRHRVNLASMLLGFGAYAEGADLLRTALADADRIGLWPIVSVAKYCLAVSLANLGSLDEARELSVDAVKRYEISGDRRFEALARSHLARILGRLSDARGASEEARRAVECARGIPTSECFALAVLACALLEEGRAEEALFAARRAVEILGSYEFIEEGAELARLAYAEALYAVGDPAAPAAIADARAQILAYASRITDERRRASYLENVTDNARTLRLALEWLGPQADDGLDLAAALEGR